MPHSKYHKVFQGRRLFPEEIAAKPSKKLQSGLARFSFVEFFIKAIFIYIKTPQLSPTSPSASHNAEPRASEEGEE